MESINYFSEQVGHDEALDALQSIVSPSGIDGVLQSSLILSGQGLFAEE